jgi:hypothetical protein
MVAGIEILSLILGFCGVFGTILYSIHRFTRLTISDYIWIIYCIFTYSIGIILINLAIQHWLF